MLTITSKLQADRYRSEKSKLNFELMINNNRLNSMTRDIDDWVEGQLTKMKKAAGNDFDKNEAMKVIESDSAYREIAAEESAMEARKVSIETEIKALDEAMTAFEKYTQTGAEKDTALWCFGG